MEPHGILTLYSTKALEYLIALGYLALFVPFWWYVSRPRAALESESAWFSLPARLCFHPGHAWVAAEGEELATVGVDAFASTLVGPLTGVELPPPGTVLARGGPGFGLKVDGRTLPMLSPLFGVVAEVNTRATECPGTVGRDPYGKGWLLRVRAPGLRDQMTTLLSGEAARDWMEQVTERLLSRSRPALATALQDGGGPVNGIAREIDPEHWDTVAAEFLLGDGKDDRHA